ncbi:2OG-Fe(II) oxygenase [Streptomyces lunaelactis]|uniref:2OG-Fe(II) oxygenase n=1 Tax=Streptomyces lunaelactis TaxID=1535768 RepID=UPI0015852B8B|nr:2OG-Fe(II) oxygenase [Streptomyces lunaelactis]NUK21938.1 2OG-Fe(II) oxygenase [Streptomyces lunaelactis]
MIHIAETVGIGSVENFLSTAERAQLADLMNTVLAPAGVDRFDVGRHASIHEIPGHSPDQAMAVYEPAGRVEIPSIPETADKILNDAFERARPALARVMPSIALCRPWTYIEYGVGQHITSHLDGIAPDPLAWPRQIAGISVVIAEAEAGGEFCVETASSHDLWSGKAPDAAANGYAPGMWLAHDGADNSAPWFQQMPRTRWSVAPEPGTALLYGSQLAHGTLPVTAGRVAKFISWLIAEPTPAG